MITLYTFGPAYALPDPSPFVIKAMLLLKMSGLAYKTDARFSQFRKAPKGKLPYIEDDGKIIADSGFIRLHIEGKYGHDFDFGYDARDRAIGYAVEKMMEETFYWATVYARWIEPQNWPISRDALFSKMPKPMQMLIPPIAQRKVRGNLQAQGLGRHSPAEIRLIAERVMRSVSDILGDKRYLQGDQPCGADATVLAFLLAASTPLITTSVVDGLKAYGNLVAYVERGKALYFG